jgi:hypothetical protein
MTFPVTTRDSLLPVLLPCPPGWTAPEELGGRGRAADGYIFSGEGGNTIPVRVLPWDFTRLLQGKRLRTLYGAYGSRLEAKEYTNLRALVLLSQLVQTGGFHLNATQGAGTTTISFSPTAGLKLYAKMQAAIRAREKEPVPTSPPEEWGKEEVQAKEVWGQLLPQTAGDPVFELARQVDRRAKSGRLVLWWSRREKTLLSGLYFAKVQDAIYALFTLQVAHPEGVGICERCGKFFKRSRVAQKFCSIKCGNYVRKKRERVKTNGGQRQ